MEEILIADLSLPSHALAIVGLALRAHGTNDGIHVSVGGSVVDVAEGIWA
jgi:hypothetical protein